MHSNLVTRSIGRRESAVPETAFRAVQPFCTAHGGQNAKTRARIGRIYAMYAMRPNNITHYNKTGRWDNDCYRHHDDHKVLVY